MLQVKWDPYKRKARNTRKICICNITCGKQICYINVIDYANLILNKTINKYKIKDKTHHKIKNKYFLRKINKICNSDQYKSFITKKHKKTH